MRNPLHSICPYFAMFPEEFVREHVETHTRAGQYVFDPFSGRGTTALESLLLGRRAFALDCNPVAYCVSGAKADVPHLSDVLARIEKYENLFRRFERDWLKQESRSLPPFFRRAYHHTTLREILFLRAVLNWVSDPIDRFVATLVLGAMHGEMDRSQAYFSNQMRRTISTKPRYSLNFWKLHKLWPRKKRVFHMLKTSAKFRLSGEAPHLRGEVRLGDVRQAADLFPQIKGKVRAVITSPPYLNVTNYEEDQWLRLWFLGYDARPTYRRFSQDNRHVERSDYWSFLEEAWTGVEPLLQKDAVLICRMGSNGLSQEELREGMLQTVRNCFGEVKILRAPVVSKIRNRQTGSFRPGSRGCVFEMDFVLGIRRVPGT